MPSASKIHWFTQLRIGTKLLLAFAALLGLTTMVGGLGVFELSRVNQTSAELANKWMPGVGHTARARAAMLDFRALEIKHSLAEDTSYMAEYEEKMKTELAAIETQISAYQALMPEDAERQQFEAFKTLWSSYLETNKKVVSLTRGGKQVDAQEISQGAAEMGLAEAIGALDKLTEAGFEGGRNAANNAQQTYMTAVMLVAALVCLAVAIGALLGWLISRDLLRTLGGEPAFATRLTGSIAEGNLYVDIELRKNDQSSLLASIRNMRNSLAGIVMHVRSGAEDIALSSREIAQGNHDLSGRTEQQASALQQTATAMAHLSGMVQQNAEGATQANALAQTASAVASQGGAVVAKVVHTMKGINDSSRKIADIISVIDGIAFQTNILALNAAVEAARAGEQGRGFAVVASEVRSLAGRSADAAKEIKGLIADSVARVEEGTALVDEAGRTMNDVVQSIRKVTDLMQDISAASHEQSKGVLQVGQSISQMDEATQQNAALVEEMAAAASSLSSQAQELVGTVAVFLLSEAEARSQGPGGSAPRLTASSQ